MLLALGALSCGKVVGDLPGDGDGGVLDARPPGTVRELRQAMPRAGDGVMLRGVVVTGRTVAKGVGVVWVQDPGGGMNSGLRLVCAFDQTCPTQRAAIEGLTIGRVLDVEGVFDVTPAPAEPQLTRFAMTPRGTMMPVAATVDAALVAHDQAGSAAVVPWLGAYVKVDGPLMVSTIMPSQLRESCAAVDAGPADAYRGVFMRPSPGARDLAVQTIELTTCVSQCGVTCADEIEQGDVFSSVTGVVIIGERGAGTPELLLRPAREMDLPR